MRPAEQRVGSPKRRFQGWACSGEEFKQFAVDAAGLLHLHHVSGSVEDLDGRTGGIPGFGQGAGEKGVTGAEGGAEPRPEVGHHQLRLGDAGGG